MDDIFEANDSFNAIVDGSFNEDNSTNNSATITAGFENVGNTDNSTNDSENLDVDVSDSFNETTDTTTTVITDSLNDNSDNSINDSGNDSSDNSINDSFNETTTTSYIDASTNAGNREYNTGFGGWGSDASVAGGGHHGGGGGDLWINSQTTIVDQSNNANVLGDYTSSSANVALVGSGDGSVVAGGDVNVTTNIDRSTDISATDGSNINIGSEVTVTNVVDSFNTVEVNNYTETNDWDISYDNVGNSFSFEATATDSFNDYDITETAFDVSVDDVNLIVDSDGSGIIGNLDVSL